MRVPSHMTPSSAPQRLDQDALMARPSLQFHLCRGRYLGLMLLGIALCAAACFSIHQPGIKAPLAGWVGVVLFPLCLLYGLIQVFQTGPDIVLPETGICDRR